MGDEGSDLMIYHIHFKVIKKDSVASCFVSQLVTING
jgi:hypothetical protein